MQTFINMDYRGETLNFEITLEGPKELHLSFVRKHIG